MKEPTQEQIKEFWEGYGFKYRKRAEGEPFWKDGMVWVNQEGKLQFRCPPPDLNNLFRYAVPFLLEKHTLIETYSFKQESGLYYSETTIWDRDERQLKGKLVGKAFVQDFDLEKANALAIFWALYWGIEK